MSTLRRKRTQLKELGAAETARGWQIPVTALITLGLMDRVTEPPSHDTPPDALTGELDALRSQLAAAEQRAAVAEAVAAERERVIQTQAMALRMLEAAAPTRPPVEEVKDNNADDVPGNVRGSENRPAVAPAASSEPQERPGHRWSPLRRLLNR